jgi:dihydrofolate reductase
MKMRREKSMSGKIILNLAMSIDGYIASDDGSFDWIIGDGDDHLDTSLKWDYTAFLKEIDVIVMGRHCYEQNMHNEFKDKKVYIATSQIIENHDNLHFLNGDICEKIIEEKNHNKSVFLFGGGILLDSFIKADIIDEYIIGIIPTILGSGRPLFLKDNPKIDLHLQELILDKGVTILKYDERTK